MNYWVFVVTERKTDEGVFKAEEIFTTRMNDSFWGLGAKTPNRKNLQKGDKVVYYVGRPHKVFAGSAVLASSALELSNEEQERYSHGKEFYTNEFGVTLEDIEIWENQISVEGLVPLLSYIENKPYWGTYFQGGVRQIPKNDFNLIMGSQQTSLVDKMLKAEDLESQAEFALETHLEEFIYNNWDSIDWGRKLKLFEAEGQDGRQFPAGTWSIDLLAVDTDTKEFVVIELKRGKTSDATIGQILRYVTWVRENMAEEGQDVHGIIIAKEIDEALKYGVKGANNVEVKTYKINFSLMSTGV